uniref:Uncharacterized protein n=1 Tax=Romanomermis culicivorax TaxID=13658 RepID=A0A915J938_ROMCU
MLGTLLVAKLGWEVDMQINKMDDQQRRHLHRSGAPQKDGNLILQKSKEPEAQALMLADGKRQEDLERDPANGKGKLMLTKKWKRKTKMNKKIEKK